ncbi:hypothetical protein MSAN_00547700 [Mycena sanguinolenta]|uniref:Uncharacterized protein n=1 Tax=Mycena sanguinolenta TaxID=230812 RepID=A0A8H6ZAK9_9AGAR|nr:hypothetical protein MSAN_00547700 [Mycena sanguinolenta]
MSSLDATSVSSTVTPRVYAWHIPNPNLHLYATSEWCSLGPHCRFELWLRAQVREMGDAARTEALRAAEREVEGAEDVDTEAVTDSPELVLHIADNVVGNV